MLCAACHCLQLALCALFRFPWTWQGRTRKTVARLPWRPCRASCSHSPAFPAKTVLCTLPVASQTQPVDRTPQVFSEALVQGQGRGGAAARCKPAGQPPIMTAAQLLAILLFVASLGSSPAFARGLAQVLGICGCSLRLAWWLHPGRTEQGWCFSPHSQPHARYGRRWPKSRPRARTRHGRHGPCVLDAVRSLVCFNVRHGGWLWLAQLCSPVLGEPHDAACHMSCPAPWPCTSRNGSSIRRHDQVVRGSFGRGLDKASTALN